MTCVSMTHAIDKNSAIVSTMGDISGAMGRRGLWRSRRLNVIETCDLHHPPKRSHVQPGVLEIEVALDSLHDVVVDDSVMA